MEVLSKIQDSKSHPLSLTIQEVEIALQNAYELGGIEKINNGGKISYSFMSCLDSNKKRFLPDKTMLYASSEDKVIKWSQFINQQTQYVQT